MSKYVCLPIVWLHHAEHDRVIRLYNHVDTYPDSKVHGDNMGPKYQAGMQDMQGLITHVLHINHFLTNILQR